MRAYSLRLQGRTICNRSTTMYQPPQAPPNRVRAKGAQHPQGVRRIRKAAKPPTAAQRAGTQKEVRNSDTYEPKSPFDAGTFITHQTKTRNRSRDCHFPPEYQPSGKIQKGGSSPRFGRPKEWGFPRGEDRAKGPFPLGVSLMTFCTNRKSSGSGPGRPGANKFA